MRSRAVAGMAAALAIACGSSAWGDGAMEDRKDAAGGFLGQVKPVLYVSDVKASAVFFRDVLGFELLSWADNEEAPYYAEMAAADQKFGLHAARDEKERQRIGKQHIYFRVRSADDHRRRVSAHGARPGPIERTAWMTMFSVVDVDGHEVVFAETDPEVHTVDPW